MADGLDDDSKSCSICWDEFAAPKNLKCGHTFCLPCLKGYQKKSKNRDEIKCPLCRQTQKVPNGCLDRLPDNYFVKLKPSEPQEKLHCSLCYEETGLKTCSHCDLKLCLSCKSSHKLALKLSNDKCESSSDSGSDEDKDLRDEASLPFHLVLSGQIIKTKFNAVLSFSFPIKSMSSNPENGQNIYVSTLHETENGLCEIITCLGPECVLVDKKGTELDRRFFDKGISDILDIGEGQKIISNFHLSMLLKVEEGKDVQLFTKTEKLNPSAVCQVNNGQIVCVGWRKAQSDNFQRTNIESVGALQYYDRHGSFLKKITGNLNENFFKRPMSMSHCELNDTICVSDSEKNCVYIFHHEGELMNRYTGGGIVRGLFSFQPSMFAPGPVCHDFEGNIILGNRVDDTIHILDPRGQFLGYLASTCDIGFGSPFSMMYDSDHRLWVGDSNDGQIRVFEITSYNNNLNTNLSLPSFPGLSLPFL